MHDRRVPIVYSPPGDPPLQVELPLRLLILGEFTPTPDRRPITERTPVPPDSGFPQRILEGAGPDSNLEVRLLNASKRDLQEDFEDAPEIGRSGLQFHLEQDRCRRPYSAILASYEFSHEPADLKFLASLASVASTNHCPLLAGFSPIVFGRDRWAEIPTDLETWFGGPQFQAWREFCASPEAGFVALLRPGSDAPPAYEVGARLVERFARTGWFDDLGALQTLRKEPLIDRLALSRLSQSIEVIGHECAGRSDFDWNGRLASYVSESPESGRPLREARFERLGCPPGEPGWEKWKLTIRLQGSDSSLTATGQIPSEVRTTRIAPDASMRVTVVPPDDPAEEVEPPFRIVVLGPFTADSRPLRERTPLRVDRGTFSRVTHGFSGSEATLLGAKFLVDHTDVDSGLELFLWNASKEDLAADPAALRSLVAESGPDWVPLVGALIGDFEFSYEPTEMALLRELASIARAAHAPFIAGASSRMFLMDSWRRFLQNLSLPSMLEGASHRELTSFRESDVAAYVGLACPRFQLGPQLWGNAAFAFGACLAAAFAKHRWCVDIAGPSSGGIVSNLPGAIEIPLSNRAESELVEAGFLPLVPIEGRPRFACFPAAPSLRKPKYFGVSRAGRAAQDNHRANSHLGPRFATARFAHALKFLEREVRDDTGAEGEERLQQWLSKFVGNATRLPRAAWSGIPFREAALRFDQPHRATLTLRPNAVDVVLTETITFGPGERDADPFGTPAARRQLYGARNQRLNLPFKMLVLGSFTNLNDDTPLQDRSPIPIDRDNFDAVLRSLEVRIGSLHIRTLRDFEADSIAQQTPELAPLLRERDELGAVRSALSVSPADPEGVSGFFGETRQLLRRGIARWNHGDVHAMIAAVEARLRDGVETIRQDARYRALESAWHGLDRLTMHGHDGVKIHLLNVTQEELLRDLEDAPSPSRTGLYHHLYHGEYEIFGGQPYALVIAADPVSAANLRLVREARGIAEKACCTLLASPFALEDASRLAQGFLRWRTEGIPWDEETLLINRLAQHAAVAYREGARGRVELNSVLREHAAPIDDPPPSILRYRPFRRAEAEILEEAEGVLLRVRAWRHGASEALTASIRLPAMDSAG